jgi:cysteine synthase
MSFAGGAAAACAVYYALHAKSADCSGGGSDIEGRGIPAVVNLIGNTPLLRLRALEESTGCVIWAKAEHMNPGGSVKDRPALRILKEAEESGLLKAGGTIVEGTGGNTGVALALLAAAKGYKSIFTMPANTSKDKIDMMTALGAKTVVCPVVPFSDKESHYYHIAERMSKEIPGAVWGNQFEGSANWSAHYSTTGPEVWKQADGKLDAIALAAGTGGTIAGLSCYLKEKNPGLRVFLIDPPGSCLTNLVNTGEMVAVPGPTKLLEGVGIARLTANFSKALPHIHKGDAFHGTDQEALDMAFFLLKHEGLLVGPSAALNVCAAVKAARRLGPGHSIATVICDGGNNYRSKLFSKEWRESNGFVISDMVTNEMNDPKLAEDARALKFVL